MNEEKEVKFLITKEIGKLAAWLRILGFDAKYCTFSQKSHIIITSLQENRIILTKNKQLCPRQGVRIVFIKSDFFRQQLKELFSGLPLVIDKNKFFSRCVFCNKELISIEKKDVQNKVPAYVFESQQEFSTCILCKRIYWKGTHWGNSEKILEKIWGAKKE